MNHDKTIPSVSPQTLTLDGGADGTLTIASTSGFFTGQDTLLSGNGSSTKLVVLDVESTTVLRMGAYVYAPFNNKPSRIQAGINLSGFTVAGGANISAPTQAKPNTDAGNVIYYVYQPDPVAALRVMTVDQQGSYVSGGGGGNSSVTILNPIPTTASSFQYAKATNSQITAGNSTQTQGFPLVTLSRNTKIIQVFNSLDAGISLALGGVETYNLETGDSFSVDAGSDGLYWASGTAISVFYNAGITATSGTIRFTGQG